MPSTLRKTHFAMSPTWQNGKQCIHNRLRKSDRIKCPECWDLTPWGCT